MIAQLAASYIAGVLLSDKFSISSILLFAAVYICIALILSRRGFRKHILVLVFCTGIVLTQFYSSADMKELAAYENKYVTISGIVCQTPDNYGENYRYFLNVKEITLDGSTKKINENIIITSPDKYSFGDSVAFTGFVSPISERLNENGFDLKRHYKSKGYFFKCYSVNSKLLQNKFRTYSPQYFAAYVHNKIANILDAHATGDKGAVLKAVIIGDKSEFSEEFGTVLNRTGTSHFFYPIFIHIMLITSVVGMFSSIMKRKYRDILTIIFLAAYTLLSCTYPIALKGGIAAILLILFRKRLGFVYFADVLGAAVLVICIANPLMLFNAGFVVSITASLLVNLFYGYTAKKIRNKYIRKTLAIGIVCTVGLLPLSAYYFNGITPYTIVTAFIFLPATFAILILSPILLTMLAIFKTAPIVSKIISLMLWIYMKAPYIIDALPFSYISCAKVAIVTIIAFYTLVFGLYLYIKNRKYPAIIAAAVSLGLSASVTAGEISRLGNVEFKFVNVGQGDGAIVQIPYKNTVLIDGGGKSGFETSDYDPGKSIYVPYLQSDGINRADCAVISHCHSDHADGIIAAIRSIRVRHVYLPETPEDNEVYIELKAAANEYGTQIHIVKNTTVLRFKSGLTITLTPPNNNALLSDDENDRSLLTRVSYGETDCLFTGDMPKTEELGLVSEGLVLQSEILKVAHHGSDTSTSSIFLDAAAPDYAVISVGENNSYGLPSDKVIKRLRDTKLLRTDKNGDLTITADKSGNIAVECYKD